MTKPQSSRGDLVIVDDNPQNLALLAGLLRDAGFSVRVAQTGRRALAATAAQPPETILLDINLPDLDGYAVCAALKADPATAAVPVIFLSALDAVGDKIEAFRHGGVDYVTKPFHAAEVVARVETQVRVHRLRSELERKNAELAQRNAELEAARQATDQIFGALSDVLAGSILDGRFRLEERIGTGATAAVYRAVDLTSGAAVAVKVLRPTLGPVRHPALAHADRERDVLLRLAHPNAVAVLHSGLTESGIAYIVMELLEGATLADEVAREGRISIARARALFVPISEMLAAAHAARVIHRDVKPQNIVLHRRADGVEVAKVVDFGIARIDDAGTHKSTTAAGGILGSPLYMAPERLLGEPSDGRADVYSLAMTLYQALAGVPPFRMPDTLAAMIMACLSEPPLPLSSLRHEAPPALEALLARALQKRAVDRPTMAELAAALPAAFDDRASSSADDGEAASLSTLDAPIRPVKVR